MELNRINLNLLLSLYHLLSNRSVTGAAQAQHLSQPAMSRNLALLRDMFNDQLLVRVGNDMQLTPRAETLWQQLPPLLDQLENLLIPSQFEASGYEGQFNIAATDFLTQQVLPPLIGELQQEAPGLSLNFHLWHPGMIDSLRQGRLDLAACILDQVPGDIYGKQVGEDSFVCLISAQHPLAECRLTLQDYINHSHIAVSGGGDKIRAVDDALAEMELTRRLKLTVPFVHSALAMTANSQYLLTLPSHMAQIAAAQYPLIKKPLPDELSVARMQYYLIWHQRLHDDPAHRYLRNRMIDCLRLKQTKVISLTDNLNQD